MKVLIVHNRYVEKGGEDTTVSNELSLLKKHGLNVEVMYFDNAGSKLAQLVKFLAYPVNIFSYFKMIRTVNRYRPDVVHLHNFFYAASPLVLWALRVKNIPIVMTVQNFRFICPSTTLFNNGKLYLNSVIKAHTFRAVRDKVYRNSFFLTLWLYLSNWFHFKIGTFGMVDKYIFASKFSKEVFEKSFLSVYKDKFLLKYNFMEPYEKPVSFDRGDDFVFIGRFTEEKGIKVLLEAFKRQTHHIKIIGDGDLKNLVLQAASENKNIEYLGFLNKEEVLNCLRTAKALIFPSIWYEGMPLTIVEAFSVGTPVIASKLGAMDEMIIDGISGFHFEPNDAVDLRQKVAKLNSLDSSTYQALISSTYNNFETIYSSDINYKKLEQIYASAMKN